MVETITQQRIEVAGSELAYYRSGTGPTVLLVHGITTYSFIWRDQFDALARGHDVIAVDLLGCGDSDMPLDVSYALTDHADRLHEFVGKLGLTRFHFVGHDLGGGMGQIFAVRHPGMLHSLSLLNSVGYDFWPVQPITAMRTPIVRQLLMATLDLGMFRHVVRHGVFHKDRVTDELMARFTAPFRTSTGRKAFLHFARCLDNHNLTSIADDLKRLAVPVLILRGRDDPYLSSAISEKLHDDIPDSRLVVLPEAGHFFQVDAPEEIATELEGFMRTCRD